MVMRYAYQHMESLRDGIGMLDRGPDGASIVLAQSANFTVSEAGRELVVRC
jgi:hypothetical protein